MCGGGVGGWVGVGVSVCVWGGGNYRSMSDSAAGLSPGVPLQCA